MKVKEAWKKFWGFLKEDSWASFIVTLIIAFVLIKFVFFPLMSLVTGTSLPIVIVESCSMYHSESLGEIIQRDFYSRYNLDFEDTKDWSFKNGLSKGDIIFVRGVTLDSLRVGDVLIFEGGSSHPIIHRVVKIDREGRVTTKGDNNPTSYTFDQNIEENQFIGKAVLRVPWVGWAKLIFFEPYQPVENKGLCD